MAEADTGKRLDQFLAHALSDVSRARVQVLLAEGKILVDGAQAKASTRMRGGETVAVLGELKLPPLRAIAEDIPLDVVYEDEEIAVINKRAGMMVHAGAGATEDARNKGTLVNALLHHFNHLSSEGGELRPGIVHRLDRETSGLVIVAKNDQAHRAMAAKFARREVKKTYVALVHGAVKRSGGTVRGLIGRDPVRRNRMAVVEKGGREAVTHYEVLKDLDTRLGRFSLLRIRIDTGRTHQIRVHMATLGHPVVGDALYGTTRGSRGRKAITDLGRNFLHAQRLEFEHPLSGKSIVLETNLPAELTIFLERIQVKDE